MKKYTYKDLSALDISDEERFSQREDAEKILVICPKCKHKAVFYYGVISSDPGLQRYLLDGLLNSSNYGENWMFKCCKCDLKKSGDFSFFNKYLPFLIVSFLFLFLILVLLSVGSNIQLNKWGIIFSFISILLMTKLFWNKVNQFYYQKFINGKIS